MPGIAVPLLRNVGDRSAGENSCAIALRPTSFAACSESGSATPSTFGNHSEVESLWQPASVAAAIAPAARARKRRRVRRSLAFMAFLPARPRPGTAR